MRSRRLRGCLDCRLAGVPGLADEGVDGLDFVPALLGDDVRKVDGSARLRWHCACEVRVDGMWRARAFDGSRQQQAWPAGST